MAHRRGTTRAAAVTGKQAIAKAARSLAEGKSEDVIAQVGSLVEENALSKSDNAVLRIEIASLARRGWTKCVPAELDAIKRAVARAPNKEDFEFGSHRSIIDDAQRDSRQGVRPHRKR